MPKIEAIVDVPFGTGVQLKGSQFDATEQEAQLLVALKRAKLVEPERTERTHAAQVEEKVVEMEAPKRAYNRRDMKAKG